jgi:hypothetical protein
LTFMNGVGIRRLTNMVSGIVFISLMSGMVLIVLCILLSIWLMVFQETLTEQSFVFLREVRKYHHGALEEDTLIQIFK